MSAASPNTSPAPTTVNATCRSLKPCWHSLKDCDAAVNPRWVSLCVGVSGCVRSSLTSETVCALDGPDLRQSALAANAWTSPGQLNARLLYMNSVDARTATTTRTKRKSVSDGKVNGLSGAPAADGC